MPRSGFSVLRQIRVLLALSLIAPLCTAQSGSWIAECPACAEHLGGSGVMGPFPSQPACEAARQQELSNNFPFGPCHLAGGAGSSADGYTSTGSLTGDVLNLGAQMWIAQNIQNPYGAQFASSFTNGFLHGLFANDTPQAQAAQLALQQQQAAQAEREREEAQRRIDAEFARLNSELKLSGGAQQLSLKTTGVSDQLQLKLSENDPGGGLPFKLGGEGESGAGGGYGIPNLPGVYTGGPAQTADPAGGLKLKLGDEPAQPEDAGMGIKGLPGLNLPGVDLNNVQPAQAAQVAGASLDLPDQQRGVVEDIALNAAQKNPELTQPSDDPFVQDFQKQTQAYDGAVAANQAALQQASEAQGHAQADQTALAYAKQQIDANPAATQLQQAYAQMQASAGSDEEVAVQARQMFEGTQVELSITRDNAAVSLAGLSPPPPDTGLVEHNAASPVTSGATPTPPAPAPSPAIHSSLPVIGASARPAILATPPPGGTPVVETVQACIARFSNKPASSPAPTLEELQKQLESNMTAMEQLEKSEHTGEKLNEDFSKEIHDAHLDIFNNGTDATLDGLLGVTKKYLELDKEAYHEALEDSMKESEQLRWEHQATAGFGQPNAIVEAHQADYVKRTQDLLAQRDGIESRLGTVETVESHFNNYKNGRDAYLFFTDNAIVPCKFSLTSVDCSELMESNGVKKLIGGDTVDRLDQLKQLMKIGAKLAEPYAEFTPYGVLALTTYSFASMGIDVLYDEYAIYLSKQRLAQLHQNDAQFARARGVLGDRLDRLNAEIGCYQSADQPAEAAR